MNASNAAEQTPAEPVDAEVIGVPKFQPARATNAEIVAHGANVMDAVSSVAENMGADGVAEITRESAKVARTIPVAVEGVKREIEPVKVAVGGLWNSLKSRGIVGTRAPINIAALSQRGVNRRSRP